MEIVAPDGTLKTLHNRSGGGTDNIIKTYTPDFDDTQIQGNWKLKIRDNANGDTGALEVSYDTVAAATVSPVTDISGSGDVYHVTVSATQDGTYNLDLVSSGHDIADAASNPLTNTAHTNQGRVATVKRVKESANSNQCTQRYCKDAQNHNGYTNPITNSARVCHANNTPPSAV